VAKLTGSDGRQFKGNRFFCYQDGMTSVATNAHTCSVQEASSIIKCGVIDTNIVFSPILACGRYFDIQVNLLKSAIRSDFAIHKNMSPSLHDTHNPEIAERLRVQRKEAIKKMAANIIIEVFPGNQKVIA